MTTARIETVYTLNDAIEELDKRLTRKIKRTFKRIKKMTYRLLLDIFKIIIGTILFYSFMSLLCYILAIFL